jgi:UDPglucose 6-dehydrogenase
MKIAFIGTGYVGLVSGVMMSSLGHEVLCIDSEPEKIAKLKQGILPIFEPSLDDHLKTAISNSLVSFKDCYDDTLKSARAIFITVGTPSLSDGNADLQYIFLAASSLKDLINDDALIIIKSTVPPGTCNKVKANLRALGMNNEVVSNPEFLREGNAVWDFLNPDRIVVGVDSDDATSVMKQIYASLLGGGVPLVVTDLISSELIKYAANSFLANKIAFINEVSDLCEIIGANVNDISVGIGLDSRIGKDFLKVGPGFGGSCFPKDILALQYLNNHLGVNSPILDAVISSNKHRHIKTSNPLK